MTLQSKGTSSFWPFINLQNEKAFAIDAAVETPGVPLMSSPKDSTPAGQPTRR